MNDDRGRIEAYAERFVRGYATLLAVVWLLLVASVAAGYVVGPAPDDRRDVTVDTTDPPAAVAADALAQLPVRDHRGVRYYRRHNATSGKTWGGIVSRWRVSHSRERLRLSVYPTAYEEGWTTPDEFHYEFYGTPTARYQRVSPGGAWRRLSRRGYGYGRNVSRLPGAARAVRNGDLRVEARNDSTLVVSTTDPSVVGAFGAPADNGTVRFVITGESDPHLSRVTFASSDGPTRINSTWEISGVGTTTVERPEDAPPPATTAFLRRTTAGLERIADWAVPVNLGRAPAPAHLPARRRAVMRLAPKA